MAEPEPARLVVEAFVETGRPLPAVTIRRTADLDDPAAAPPVADAVVTLTLGGEAVGYAPVPGQPGRYAPQRALAAASGATLRLEVTALGQRATAASLLPAPITLDSVRVVPAAAPVEAVFADSLGLEVREGFLYPVDVTLYWTAPAADSNADSSWVRARLSPPAAFPSAVVDFVLLTDATRREADLAAGGAVRRWSGVYAVPVDTSDDPLPPHALDVALLRSGPDYARYALSRTDPDRREPVGNVTGGIGIAVGLALDRWTLAVGE
ncbi:MAG: DUF4249 family protein [Rhodothermales bacterium]